MKTLIIALLTFCSLAGFSEDNKEDRIPVPTCTINISPEDLMKGKPYKAKFRDCPKKKKEAEKSKTIPITEDCVRSFEVGCLYYGEFEDFLRRCKFAGAKINWIKGDGWLTKIFTIKGRRDDIEKMMNSWNSRFTQEGN